MRVAVVWPLSHRLADVSIPCGLYVQGFRELGHEAFAVCSREAAQGFSASVIPGPTDAALRDPAFWRSLELDAAVVVTWLGMADVLRALRPACPYVVSLADSDGQVGVRAHPAANWRRMLAQHPSWGNKLRAAKYWLQQYAWSYRRVEAPLLESAALADVIAVGSNAGMGHLHAYFASRSRPELARKLHLSPYPVAPCFRDHPLPEKRADRILAIGRWADPQKDAPLLAAALGLALRRRPQTEVLLIGSGGEAPFGKLCHTQTRVRYLGQQTPAQVAQHLSTSRALVFSSRWEGSPIVANEALAMGCTLVGPAMLPGVASLVGAGAFGTLAGRRTPRSLANAICGELTRWDHGARSPVAVAAQWRPLLHPQRVCRDLLAEPTAVRPTLAMAASRC